MAAIDLSSMQLELVSFERDRQHIFESMASRRMLVSAIGRDHIQFQFALEKIERSQIYLHLQAPYPRKPLSHEPLTVTFGLDEGQYFLRGDLEVISGDSYVMPIGEKLYRMQRRAHFRAPMPEAMKALFRLRKIEGGITSHDLMISDISGGGLGLLIPKNRSLPAVPGDAIRGTLTMVDREPMELEGVIRHVWPPDHEGTVKIGLQFCNLTKQQERELVIISMGIHREFFSMFRAFKR